MKSFAELQELLIDRRGEELDFVIERGSRDKAERIPVKVAPNRFRTLGLSMAIETISAVETKSPADDVGLRVKDRIIRVDGQDVGLTLDPIELPDYFQKKHGQEVEIVYTREIDSGSVKEFTAKQANTAP